jgi:hypothetical protein
MIEECVILFLHHKDDTVTNYHLKMFEKHNPHYKIVPLTPESSPKSNLWNYDNMWMYNDTMIYNWIESNNFIKAKRYCWFDWDTLCLESVDKYFEKVWNDDISGTQIHTEQSNQSWQWFNHAKKNTELYRKYKTKLLGITPFCGILIQGDVLLSSLEYMKKENNLWRNQMNELRLSTCANIIGANIKSVDKNSIQPFQNCNSNGNIKHPIKLVKEEYMIRQKEFKKIIVVSPAFSNSNEIIRDLEASMEINTNWNINYLGRGECMKHYIHAKIEKVYEFLKINENNYDWVIVLDSNDSLILRNFNEVEILDILNSFNRPIIFSGESECYPIKQLNGLYTSKSINRYLNSGVIAIRKDFVNRLFDHVLFLYNNFEEYKTIGWGSPNDQTYYQLCLFSTELNQYIVIDEKGLLSVSTHNIPDKYFDIIDNRLFFNNKSSQPYILHCQGNDKHQRKRDFMRKLNIPVRG